VRTTLGSRKERAVLLWSILALLFIVHGLGLWMAIHVIMNGRTAQGTIAWVMALIFMPWLALPLYLVLGDYKFVGYQRGTPGGTREIDRIAQTLTQSLRDFAQRDDAQAAIDPTLERLAQFPATQGNQVTLLIDGAATFEAITEAIDAATHYILIEFFTIRDDGLGQRVQRALIAARVRGVRVHLLYDEFGSSTLPGSYLKVLTDAGCECTGFRTKTTRRRPFRINFRNHRKIVIVDGRVAFVGGHNIGDEYLGLDKVLTPWRDTHVAIRGPAVQCVQMAFAESWFWAKDCVPDLDWSPQRVDSANATVLIVPSGPADDLETGSLLFTRLASSAKATLWLSTAYFVPDDSFVSALQLAALRGADVRLMIPEISDNRATKLASYTFYEELIPVGVRILTYKPGFLHQKLALADSHVCVGSANLDNRSFRLNFEISVVVCDQQFTSDVAAMLANDISNTQLAQPSDFAARSYWFQFCCRVARLMAPVL